MSELPNPPQEPVKPVRKQARRPKAKESSGLSKSEVQRMINAAVQDALSSLVTMPEVQSSGVGKEEVIERKLPDVSPNDPNWGYQRVDFFPDDIENELGDRHAGMIESGWELVARTKRRALYRLPRAEFERRHQRGFEASAERLGGHVSKVNEKNQREEVITASVLQEIEAENGPIDSRLKAKVMADLAAE